MFCGSGGSKSRLSKGAGAETAGQMRDQKLHAILVCRCLKQTWKQKQSKHFSLGELLEGEMSKKCTPLRHQGSQNVQNTPFSEHFWKLRCSKSARGNGSKHISKSRCLETEALGPLLTVATSKKYTPEHIAK